MFRIEKRIRPLICSVVIGTMVFCVGCNSVGIGGNPELMTKEEESEENEKKEEKSVFPSTYSEVEKAIKKSGVSMKKEELEEVNGAGIRLENTEDKIVVEIFDTEKEHGNTNCVYITFGKESWKEKPVNGMLKSIYEQLGLTYDQSFVADCFFQTNKLQEGPYEVVYEKAYIAMIKSDGKVQMRIMADIPDDMKDVDEKMCFSSDRNQLVKMILDNYEDTEETRAEGDDVSCAKAVKKKDRLFRVDVFDNNAGTATQNIQIIFDQKALRSEDSANRKEALRLLKDIFLELELTYNQEQMENLMEKYIQSVEEIDESLELENGGELFFSSYYNVVQVNLLAPCMG